MFPFDEEVIETLMFYIQLAYLAGFLVVAGIAALLIKKYVINRR
tara:strand:- start:705 stop:836 length:132 start_codon:yes stop_codon:yes gene_type:complete